MIEWKTVGVGAYEASAGLITLELMAVPLAYGREWVVCVDDSDTGATRAEERFTGTLGEAQARAVELATRLVAPLVAGAVAAERAAIRAKVESLRSEWQRSRLSLDAAPQQALTEALEWLDARSKGEAK